MIAATVMFVALAYVFFASAVSFSKAYKAVFPVPPFRKGPFGTAGMERLRIRTPEGNTIVGLYRANPQRDKLVLLSHHAGGNKEALLKHARLVYGMGYSVFIFDYSRHGESAGRKRRSLFKQFLKDIENVITYLKVVHRPKELVLFAFSLSTFVALHAASRDPSIKAIICDSGPAISYGVIFKRLRDRVWTGRRDLLGRWLFPLWCRILVGGPTPGHIARSLKHKRLLILQGRKDYIIPEEGVLKFFCKLNGCERSYIPFPHAGHLTCLALDKENYERALSEFLHRSTTQ
ncbi:MAG: alpha/beta hydrolase [Syntrophorhabdales bacterium]|jgi:pimeloyl-ACP methyl ester carboxylesterase